MVPFSDSSLYSLGKITPGLTQRINLVSDSADNTRLCNTQKRDIVFKQCVGGKAKKKKNAQD